MNLTKLLSAGFLLIFLTGCGRSPETQFYILNPLPLQKNSSSVHKTLQIGIDEISTPAYAEKLQIMVHDDANEVRLEEYHQWAENLDKTVRRVIETNLSFLLPGAVVEMAPWDSKFKPDYHLQVDISDFTVQASGTSILRAEVLVFDHEQLVKKRDLNYVIKVPNPDISRLVSSMNANLNHLSRDIAGMFKGYML